MPRGALCRVLLLVAYARTAYAAYAYVPTVERRWIVTR
jgi:hypothetical protein